MNEEQLEAEIERLNAHCKRMASDLVDIADDHSRLFHENARLKAEVEAVRQEYSDATNHYNRLHNDLQAEVDRLTKAVMHSPAAQLKLKELEGKTTFDEINPKDDNSNITTELLVLCNRQASDIRRLTKAGDAMAELMFIDKDYIGSPKQEAVVEWCKATEAKEGKPRA
jgi:predicted nuclease with TOPRIM domain